MRRTLFHLCLLCFVCFWGTASHASILKQSSLENEDDSLRISLLTCSPGQEVYALYGHTAIRVYYPNAGIDEVYNYGLFDFESDNFAWRFALGQTDYYLGKVNYARFGEAYLRRGSYLVEQWLNLTQAEAFRLWQNLNDTLQSPQRVYRYNYFYKNCSSMARDQIVRAIAGHVEYSKAWQLRAPKSFRQIIHEYTAGHPWDEATQDMLLGYGADTAVELNLQQFAPEYLQQSFADAGIRDISGVWRPLVALTDTIGDVPNNVAKEQRFLPWHAGLLLLLLTSVLLLWEQKAGRTFWYWDMLLMLLQGIPGVVVSFLVLFSEHPTVDTNWVVCLLNPLPLVYLARYAYLQKKGRASNYHYFGIVMALGVLLPFCLQWQDIPLILIFLAFNLLLLHSVRLYQQRAKVTNTTK